MWRELFEEERIDLDFYLYRERERGEILPWDHIDAGVTKEFLWSEYKRALYSADGGNVTYMETPDCKVDTCSGCGVCDFEKIQNITFYDKDMEGTTPLPSPPEDRSQDAFPSTNHANPVKRPPSGEERAAGEDTDSLLQDRGYEVCEPP